MLQPGFRPAWSLLQSAGWKTGGRLEGLTPPDYAGRVISRSSVIWTFLLRTSRPTVSRRNLLCYSVSVARETMTVRVETRTKKELDGIATALERDRSYVVNEALKAYIDVHQWQIDHIRQGLREANAGKFASEDEVKKAISRLRRK